MFSKHATGKVVLVTDVDDMSVGVSIVHLTDGPAEILHKERMMLSVEERTKEHGAAVIAQLLEQCVEKILKSYAGGDEKHAPKPPAAVYAILHAPWTLFRTAEAEESYEKPVAVGKELINSLAKKALETSSGFDKANSLEAGVMHAYLNGYPTGAPLGKHATRVSVIAFESSVQPEIKKAVTDVLSKMLPGRTPVVRSSMSALLAVLGEHLPDIHRFLVLDVGSSVTDCAVVLKESVAHNELVAEGLTTILARVTGGGLPEETMTQLRMLASDTCANDACKALKDALARAEPDLAKIYGEAFAKLAAKRRLPNRVMLSAPVELAPWMTTFFARIDFSQFTATMQPMAVETLTAEHMRDAVVWKGAAPDTALGIAASYVNILEMRR